MQLLQIYNWNYELSVCVCACVCVWDRDWRCRSCHRYGRDVPQESLGLSNRAGGQESDLYTGARAG